MKSFRFNRNDAVIRGYKEDPLPQKRINWDRIIYLIVFFFILGSLALYVIRRNFYASAFGEVISDKFEVKFSDDIKVTNYLINENQVVEVGDTLFLLKPELAPKDSLGVTVVNDGGNSQFDWIDREKMSTMKSIRLKELEIGRLERELKRDYNRLSSLKDEVYLAVETANVLQQKQMSIRISIADVEGLKEEIVLLKRYLSQLNQMARQRNRASVRSSRVMTGKVAYTSPVNGMVSQVYATENEVTYRQEVVMDLVRKDELFVTAYIPQEYLNHFMVNDTIGVKFGGRIKSLGVIDNIYFNTEQLPNEFRKTYQKSPRTVIARIVPLNEKVKRNWEPYYKIGVEVYQPKFLKKWWLGFRLKSFRRNGEL